MEETKFFGREEDTEPSQIEKVIKQLKEIDREYIIEKINIPKVEKRIDGAYDKADQIQHLWETFVIADMLGYVFVGILVVFFVMLAYILRKYNIAKVMFAFMALLVALNGGKLTKYAIDSIARSSNLENLEIQRFDYSDNMVINVDLKNTGKFDYAECTVHFTFYKQTDREPINIINKIKPLHEQTVKLKDIKKNTYKHIRMTIYTISRDLNFTMENKRKCK